MKTNSTSQPSSNMIPCRAGECSAPGAAEAHRASGKRPTVRLRVLRTGPAPSTDTDPTARPARAPAPGRTRP